MHGYKFPQRQAKAEPVSGDGVSMYSVKNGIVE